MWQRVRFGSERSSVQIRVPRPRSQISAAEQYRHARVAQRISAQASGARGPEFDSRRGYFASIAQLAELPTLDRDVAGSIPAGGTWPAAPANDNHLSLVREHAPVAQRQSNRLQRGCAWVRVPPGVLTPIVMRRFGRDSVRRW